MTNLVLKPLKLLERDVAEVGGYDFDPVRDGCKVIERGEGLVGIVIEAIWSPDSDLRRVGQGLVGGVLLSGGATGRREVGNLENRVLDIPWFDRVGAGKAAGVERGCVFAPCGPAFAVA